MRIKTAVFFRRRYIFHRPGRGSGDFPKFVRICPALFAPRPDRPGVNPRPVRDVVFNRRAVPDPDPPPDRYAGVNRRAHPDLAEIADRYAAAAGRARRKIDAASEMIIMRKNGSGV